jgi:hypothetical protein
MAETVCLIKCTHCKSQFPSPVQFGTAEAYFTSTLVGNEVTCSRCKKSTACNRDNMYFNDRTGTVDHGEQTIPTG